MINFLCEWLGKEKNEIKSYEVEADNDSEGAQETFVEKKVVDNEKIANEQKTDDNKLAFFDLQRPKKVRKKIKKIIMSVFYYRLQGIKELLALLF